MRNRTIRRGVPAALLLAAGLTVTACGPGDPSSSSAPSGTVVTATPTATATSASGGPSPTTPAVPSATAPDGGAPATGSGPAPAGSAATDPGSGAGPAPGSGGPTEPACATGHLKLTAQNLSSGAGSTTFDIAFQNTGNAPCTLRGYPGVSFVDAHGVQLGRAASRTGGATTVVTLIPGAHAYAGVRTVNGMGGYSPSQCGLATVPALRVYPPNQTASAGIPWHRQECVAAGVQNLVVGPVHSGR